MVSVPLKDHAVEVNIEFLSKSVHRAQEVVLCTHLRLIDWLMWLRPDGQYIHKLVSHIHTQIPLHIHLSLHICLLWYKPLSIDTNYTPDTNHSSLTAHQIDLYCKAHDASKIQTLIDLKLSSHHSWFSLLDKLNCSIHHYWADSVYITIWRVVHLPCSTLIRTTKAFRSPPRVGKIQGEWHPSM